VISVGVDIAKDAKNTALCEIRWAESEAVVELLELRVSDARIVERARAARVTALDAPFGWPTAMVHAVSNWIPGGSWSKPTDAAFRLRATEDATRRIVVDAISRRSSPSSTAIEPVSPLSVSSDKIAMASWRVCGVLDVLGHDCTVVTSRLGEELGSGPHIVEAYPAAALAVWSIERTGYKKATDAGARRRGAMLAAITRQLSRRVRWSGTDESTCVATDHALDAFVCALVARAAALGKVHSVPDEQRDTARCEGWITLPLADALTML